MKELLSFLQKSPEEQLEKAVVKRNTQLRGAGLAAGASFCIFLCFAASGHENAGLFLACLAFLPGWLVAAGFVRLSEDHASKARIAERHEQRRRNEMKTEADWQIQQQLAEVKRLELIRKGERDGEIKDEEQQRRESRSFVVTKLHAAGSALIHYDASASIQERNRVKQALADQLSDIGAQYTRYELTSLIERYPEVRSAVVSLRRELTAHKLESPVASEIFSAIP